LNIRQIAIVTIRVASIGWLFSAVALLTYLPADFARARLAATAHVPGTSAISLNAAIVNLTLHVGFALALYIYARPLAAFVTDDLEGEAEQADASVTAG
jgi:hypothetical protein